MEFFPVTVQHSEMLFLIFKIENKSIEAIQSARIQVILFNISSNI